MSGGYTVHDLCNGEMADKRITKPMPDDDGICAAGQPLSRSPGRLK